MYQNARFHAKIENLDLEPKTPYLNEKFHPKGRYFKIKTKIPYIGIFKLELKKKRLSNLTPAPWNFSKCKVLRKTKNLQL